MLRMHRVDGVFCLSGSGDMRGIKAIKAVRCSTDKLLCTLTVARTRVSDEPFCSRNLNAAMSDKHELSM
jgi:hypothetical protein